MARLARVVAPGVPHHVTQRGNRRQETFFDPQDYRAYLDLMAEWCPGCGVEIWAYCLMPNHVHLIATPRTADGLARAIGEVHRRYARRINARQGWIGHLWQSRFASFPLDEPHLLMAARYVELIPVQARLAKKPGEYAWSSARAHLEGRDDGLVKVAPLLALVDDWAGFLAQGLAEEDAERLRRHERTGRPLGSEAFVAALERRLRRPLRPGRRGPKPKKRGA